MRHPPKNPSNHPIFGHFSKFVQCVLRIFFGSVQLCWALPNYSFQCKPGDPQPSWELPAERERCWLVDGWKKGCVGGQELGFGSNSWCGLGVGWPPWSLVVVAESQIWLFDTDTNQREHKTCSKWPGGIPQQPEGWLYVIEWLWQKKE